MMHRGSHSHGIVT